MVCPPLCPALVFVPAEQLSRGHPDFRPLWPGEEQALQAAAGAHDSAGHEGYPGFVVPSDSELGLRPGAAQQCTDALVAMHRAQQLVSAARSGLGPANPGGVNAPGRGVTEMVSPVRTLLREALLTAEV